MRLARYRRLRVLLVVVAALVAASVGVALQLTGVLKSVELATVDLRFELRGTQPSPGDVVVVEIDQGSLDQLGATWPLVRSLHARAIDRLVSAGARTIVFDVVFSGAKEPHEDADLRKAISRAGNVVLGTTDTAIGSTTILGGRFDRARTRLGSTQAPPEPDGTIRRLASRPAEIAALALVAAERHGHRRIQAPSERFWIDYRGPAGTIPTVRFTDLLAGRVPASVLRERAVVIGPSAPSVGDLFPVPVADNEYMSGAEIQATAIHTALAGFPLRQTPGAVGILLILATAAVPAAAGLARRRLVALALVAAAALSLLAGLYLAFLAGEIAPAVTPVTTLFLATLGVTGARALTSALQRQHVRDVFGRFVPGSVVDEALAKTGADLRLGGTELDATVLFCDLRGFTQFSETLKPARVIAVLNEYLSSMSDAILDHGGTLTAYMGDGIMAVFGAPIAQPDHADRAVAAAIEMVGDRLGGFNDWLSEGGVEHRFSMGIGINSGSVLSGNVGSARRLEYTAVGDTTNTASRLEAMTKDTLYQVFVADSTRRRMTSTEALVSVGDLEVRGREQPVQVWALSP